MVESLLSQTCLSQTCLITHCVESNVVWFSLSTFLLPTNVCFSQRLASSSDQKLASFPNSVAQSNGKDDGASPLTDTVRVGRYGFYSPHTTTLNEIGISYKVDFPMVPEVKQFAAKTAGGTVRRRTYALVHKEVNYTLTTIEYPAKFLESRKWDITQPFKVLNRTLNGVLSAKEGSKSVHRGRVQVAQPPGMEMIVSFPAGVDAKSNPYPAGVLYQRSFLDGYSIHTVTAEMSKSAYQKDSTASQSVLSAFLESFVKVQEDLRFFMQTEPKGRL